MYKVIDYFRTSPKRAEFFRDSQDEAMENVKSLIVPFDIRWSSFYSAISRIMERFSSLVNAFKNISDEEGDPTALGFYLKLTSLETVSIIVTLDDLLRPFYMLDKKLQESSLPLGTALDKIEEVKDELEKMYMNPNDYGLWLAILKDQYECENKIQGIDIKNKINLDFSQIRERAISCRDTLLSKLSEKFDLVKNLKVFEILDLSTLIKEKKQWEANRYSYKEKEIMDLLTYYNSHVPHSENISEKLLLQDWSIVKSYLLYKCKKLSNKDIYQELFGMECAELFVKIIKFYLVHPVSNASVERGFSLMNLIKSDVRSRMLDDLLDASMSIKYNGLDGNKLELNSEIFLLAEEHWINQRKRRFI